MCSDSSASDSDEDESGELWHEQRRKMKQALEQARKQQQLAAAAAAQNNNRPTHHARTRKSPATSSTPATAATHAKGVGTSSAPVQNSVPSSIQESPAEQHDDATKAKKLDDFKYELLLSAWLCVLYNCSIRSTNKALPYLIVETHYR